MRHAHGRHAPHARLGVSLLWAEPGAVRCARGWGWGLGLGLGLGWGWDGDEVGVGVGVKVGVGLGREGRERSFAFKRQ